MSEKPMMGSPGELGDPNLCKSLMVP